MVNSFEVDQRQERKCLQVVSKSAQGLKGGKVPEDVAVHGEQRAGDLRELLRGGSREGAEGQLRLPLRVHDAALSAPEKLQSHADRGTS